MNPLARRPFRLAANRVNYLLPGGEMIDEFLGLPRGSAPGASQMWVASTVQSTLPGAADSRSYILPADGGGCLAEALQRDPAAFLGQKHAAAFGADPGFLLKLLHSSQRLLVQAHPDRARAEKYFHWPHGKTEAWYVLATEGEAYVWAGFRPGVTREAFAALIEKQDTAAILGCLHRFSIAPGDVIFIPAGLPHAMGANSLVAEIQEPTDITLRAEYIRPDGSRLPPESLHGGAGMDALLDCFDFSCAAPREAVRERYFLWPERRAVPGGVETTLVGPAATCCFGLVRLALTGPCPRQNPAFRVLLVEQGGGELSGGGVTLPLHQGAEVFVPAGVGEYTLTPTGKGLAVLECIPPLALTKHTRNAPPCRGAQPPRAPRPPDQKK